LLYTNFV